MFGRFHNCTFRRTNVPNVRPVRLEERPDETSSRTHFHNWVPWKWSWTVHDRYVGTPGRINYERGYVLGVPLVRLDVPVSNMLELGTFRTYVHYFGLVVHAFTIVRPHVPPCRAYRDVLANVRPDVSFVKVWTTWTYVQYVRTYSRYDLDVTGRTIVKAALHCYPSRLAPGV